MCIFNIMAVSIFSLEIVSCSWQIGKYFHGLNCQCPGIEIHVGVVVRIALYFQCYLGPSRIKFWGKEKLEPNVTLGCKYLY